MKSWILALLTLALLALVPLSLWSGRGDKDDALADEILAYELVEGRTIELMLPADHSEVMVTSWCLVDPLDRDAVVPYALHATMLDAEGGVRAESTFHLESRVSVSADGVFGARLAERTELWVTDARTLTFGDEAVARGGRLRLRAEAPGTHGVLVTAVYRQLRTEVAQQAALAALQAEERRQLVQTRSSLAFFELPRHTQMQALDTWGRRLDARIVGTSEQVVRRLFLGELSRRPARIGTPAGLTLGARRSVAFNFDRPVELRVVGPPHTTLVAEGAEVVEPLGEGGVALVRSAIDGAHSVVLRGDGEPVQVFVQTSLAFDEAQIGVVDHERPEQGVVTLGPDVLTMRYFMLDAVAPVRVRVAEGQNVLGLYVRGLPAADGDDLAATLVARWVDGEGHDGQATLDVAAPYSPFERWRDGEPATDAVRAMLSVPRGVEEITLTGDPRLAVRPWALDPMVEEDLLEAPYREHALSDEQRWRYGRFEERQRAAVEPINREALALAGRARWLRAQTRIETRGAAEPPPPRPESTLLPWGNPVQRRYLRAYRGGAPYPPDVVTLVTGAATLLAPSTGQLQIDYLVDDDHLGREVQLSVDGQVAASEEAIIRAGRFDVHVGAGARRVELDGLGPRGVALARAGPVGGGRVYRERIVNRLAGGGLGFGFGVSSPGARLLVLMVVSEGGPYRLGWSVDGGTPRVREGAFFQRATVGKGGAAGVSGSHGEGLLWVGGAGALGTLGWSKVVIPLGDDLDLGAHQLALQSQGGALWVRAVLVGAPQHHDDESTLYVRPR